MKLFKSRFSMYDKYTPLVNGDVPSDWVKLQSNEIEGWTEFEVETNFIDTSDWLRKGSLSVDGYFIHDDFRAGGDMKLFVNINGEWVELIKPQ